MSGSKFGEPFTPEEIQSRRIDDLEWKVKALTEIIEKMTSGQPFAVKHGWRGLELVDRPR